jgi:hypothetical protein
MREQATVTSSGSVMVETRVYSLDQEHQLWVGTSETKDPANATDVIRDLAGVIAKADTRAGVSTPQRCSRQGVSRRIATPLLRLDTLPRRGTPAGQRADPDAPQQECRAITGALMTGVLRTDRHVGSEREVSRVNDTSRSRVRTRARAAGPARSAPHAASEAH